MSQFSVSLAPSRLDQTINPWTWNIGSLSLFSVNLGESSDPTLESRILAQVGSYGRQIGQIGDALAVLIAHADLSGLSEKEQAAIDDLHLQLGEIAKQKRKRKDELASAA
jgi:hypothetical protein